MDDSYFVIVFRVAVPKTLPPTTTSQEKTRMLMPLSPINVPLRLGRYVHKKKKEKGSRFTQGIIRMVSLMKKLHPSH